MMNWNIAEAAVRGEALPPVRPESLWSKLKRRVFWWLP